MSKEIVLEALRTVIEHTTEDLATGVTTGGVFLPNAESIVLAKGISRHQFAGYLSALKADGLYTPEEGPNSGYFGEVVLA